MLIYLTFFFHQIVWKKDGQEVKSDGHFMISLSYGICALEVSTAEMSDTGRYTCIATNELAQIETGCKVTVESKYFIY